MIKTLERNGLIEKTPGQPRSIRLVAPEYLPRFDVALAIKSIDRRAMVQSRGDGNLPWQSDRCPYHVRRNPNRICRWSSVALNTCMKSDEFTLLLGLAKCGVFVELNASVRNSRVNRSVSGNLRKTPRSRFTTPGPRRMLRPALPNRTALTAANAFGSKKNWPGPTPPSFSTAGLTWSAVCVLPGAFNAAPEADTENGLP